MAGALEDVQAEDYVEYFLFPNGLFDLKSEEEVNESLSSTVSLINCCASEHKQEYIWHKDPFNIAPISQDCSGLVPPHLHGTTHFGDNIEDEWFIVYLLLQLTKDIDGLVIRVVDSDGEFLLIEAAEYLPAWADPETCGQRVYLYQGEIHFIPFEGGKKPEGDTPKKLSVSSAIQLIRSTPEKTRALQPIQDAINERVAGYPSKIKENLHRTTLSIPVEISALLKDNPSLISPAVRAFCERDPIDKRVCRNMAHFKPDKCVMTSVIFTRCLYAMLCHEKAVPDKRSGWLSPPPNSPTFKMFNLSYKVTCGFEILIDRAKKIGNVNHVSENTAATNISDLSCDRGWILYLNCLKRKGYFKDLLEGSKEHTALQEKAMEFYVRNCLSSAKLMPETSAGHEILSRLPTLQLDLGALDVDPKNLPPPDDDSWLELSSEEVDLMLKNRYGPIGDRMKKGQLHDQKGLANVLGDFLDYVSGVDGAEFPNQDSFNASSKLSAVSDKTVKLSSVSSQASSNEESADSRLNFEPDGFSCAVQNILDFVIPEDSWDLNSDSDDSDIGSYEDDGEMDLDEIKPAGKKQSSKAKLRQYMSQMDQELASTTMAQSFERKAPKSDMPKPGTSQEDDSFDDVEDFQPVDIDMNALKNILESYQSQMGGSGPASNLLGPMGVHLEALTRKSSDNNDD